MQQGILSDCPWQVRGLSAAACKAAPLRFFLRALCHLILPVSFIFYDKDYRGLFWCFLQRSIFVKIY